MIIMRRDTLKDDHSLLFQKWPQRKKEKEKKKVFLGRRHRPTLELRV